jgi:hypothetical protein
VAVQVGVKTFNTEDPFLPWLGRAGNLTSPRSLSQRDLMQADVESCVLEKHGAHLGPMNPKLGPSPPICGLEVKDAVQGTMDHALRCPRTTARPTTSMA